MTGAQGEELIPEEEEGKFQLVLIEATRRFVTAVKKRTGQWDLDTRHPVGAYDLKYFREGKVVATRFPLEEGYKRVPGSASAVLWSKWRLLRESTSFSKQVWRDLDLSKSQTMPLHEDLFYDSITFFGNRRFDAAILYAAMATELLLKKICRDVLKAKNELTDKQCKELLEDRRNPSLVRLLETLRPELNVDRKGLERLFEQRNKIVHGDRTKFTAKEAEELFSIAISFRVALDAMLVS